MNKILVDKPELFDLKQWASKDSAISEYDNIPIGRLKNVQGRISDLLKGSEHCLHIRYRGPRFSNPQHTLKKEATAFSVYLKKRPAKKSVQPKIPDRIWVDSVEYKRV